MNRYSVKVCGMRDAANVLDLMKLGVDALGFIFVPASPRFVGWNYTLPSRERESPLSVAVVKNEPLDTVTELLDRGFDAIQLHGDEEQSFCRSIRKLFPGKKIIRAIAIDVDGSFEFCNKYEALVDLILFDSSSSLGGGSGEPFDWKLLSRYRGTTPFVLAGGVGPGNIRGAIDFVRGSPCWGFDVNSRVEESPGLKSYEKVSQVLQEARRGV